MAIIDTSKIILELAKTGMTVELQEQLMQLREEALELQEENLKLKTENIELKKKEELQEKVKFKRKVYYREGDDVPYCPYCYEKHQLLLHFTESGPTPEGGQFYDCQECRRVYKTKDEEDFTFYNKRHN